jgi:hypothetical protein
MSFKDDPLQQQRFAPRALWLDREGMEKARENFYRAWAEATPGMGHGRDREIWDISFAAALAAFSFVMEGRLEP